MDALDWRIIEALQEDGRLGYRELARDLGVSPGTIRLRTRQLLDEGHLRVIAVPTTKLLEGLYQATIGLRLAPGHAREASDILSARPEVGWVGLTSSGQYDLLFEVILADSADLGPYREEFLASLPGCEAIEVFNIWEVSKFGYDIARAHAKLQWSAQHSDQDPAA
ncbi:MAG: Lrp/AsnC family transcriptional regulator [Leucobacter sp.]